MVMTFNSFQLICKLCRHDLKLPSLVYLSYLKRKVTLFIVLASFIFKRQNKILVWCNYCNLFHNFWHIGIQLNSYFIIITAIFQKQSFDSLMQQSFRRMEFSMSNSDRITDYLKYATQDANIDQIGTRIKMGGRKL